VRENRTHGSKRRGWKRSDLATVTAVKRPAGESRGKVAAGPDVRNRHRASPRPYRGEARLVTDRVMPVFGGYIWFACPCGWRRARHARAAPAPTAPGWPPFRVEGRGWLVRRVRAERTAAASRSGIPLSRAKPVETFMPGPVRWADAGTASSAAAASRLRRSADD